MIWIFIKILAQSFYYFSYIKIIIILAIAEIRKSYSRYIYRF